MPRKYISELIPEIDIGCWSKGERVLITSQTGSGKSEFIKNRLYQYCQKNGGRVLMLSNRVLLKEQIKEDLKAEDKDESGIITIINYQSLEHSILSGRALERLFEPYTYIVYDEVHYIFADSQFNRNTDLLIEPIKNTPKEKVFIFITATPQALLDYQPYFDFTYSLPYDYSYIDNIYFYNSVDIAESILQNLPNDEKAIYFASNAKEALELSQRFASTSFICSEGNLLYDFSDKKVISQIAENSQFDERFLFATKVLDNGVNIKDSAVKHILIDMLDPISFLQCLGRKRILEEDDKINLYIKNYHNGNLKYALRGYENKLATLDEFELLTEEEFRAKYRKRDFDDVIDNDFTINMAKYQNYHTQIRLLRKMLLSGNKDGYAKYICDLLNYNYNNIKDGNITFEKRTLKDLLAEYCGKKIFSEEQERFKALFFDNIFAPKKTNYRRRGIRSINSILQEDNLPYMLSSRRETSGGRRREYYWIITDIENL